LGNLPLDAAKEDVYQHLKGMGLTPRRVNLNGTGYGFVKFDKKSFPLALEQPTFKIGENLVSVSAVGSEKTAD
jgi:hypothetical protein